MPVPSWRDCASILAAHGITGALQGLKVVSDEANADKLFVCETQTDSGRYIVKLREEHYRSKDLIEVQSDFAHALSLSGVPTACRYLAADGWASVMLLGGRRYFATVENHVGEEGFSLFGAGEARCLGRLLGELHRVSIEHHLQVGHSFLTADLLEGRADLRRVFARYSGHAECADAIEPVAKLHDALVAELVCEMGQLPSSAVHGDIGAANNIAFANGRATLFDFDNAGDEALLLDFFSTWFGSLRCLREAGKLADTDEGLYLAYLKGYLSSRSFTHDEHRLAPVASALFCGLHDCRYLLETTGRVTSTVLSRVERSLHTTLPLTA